MLLAGHMQWITISRHANQPVSGRYSMTMTELLCHIYIALKLPFFCIISPEYP